MGFVNHLHAHDTCTGARSAVSSGNAADTDSVIVNCSNGSGHMGTMVSRRNLAGRLTSAVNEEVIAVYIIYIAVVVIIHGWKAVEFGLVYPHICGKVLVSIIDAHVADCYDNFRLTCLDCPGLESVYIAALCPLSLSSGIMVMPLNGQVGIVERIRYFFQRLDLRHRFHYIHIRKR